MVTIRSCLNSMDKMPLYFREANIFPSHFYLSTGLSSNCNMYKGVQISVLAGCWSYFHNLNVVWIRGQK